MSEHPLESRKPLAKGTDQGAPERTEPASASGVSGSGPAISPRMSNRAIRTTGEVVSEALRSSKWFVTETALTDRLTADSTGQGPSSLIDPEASGGKVQLDAAIGSGNSIASALGRLGVSDRAPGSPDPSVSIADPGPEAPQPPARPFANSRLGVHLPPIMADLGPSAPQEFSPGPWSTDPSTSLPPAPGHGDGAPGSQPGGGVPVIDLSTTNELLQQLVDLVRKERSNFLPVNNRRDNYSL